jgi:hypothetical protein
VLIPFKAHEYDEFREKAQGLTARRLPEYAGRRIGATTLRAVLYFEADWTARLVPIIEKATGWEQSPMIGTSSPTTNLSFGRSWRMRWAGPEPNMTMAARDNLTVPHNYGFCGLLRVVGAIDGPPKKLVSGAALQSWTSQYCARVPISPRRSELRAHSSLSP